MMWFLQIVRAFFYMLDSTLFNFIPTVYDFLIMISRTSILSQGKIQEFADRIQALLGVFMLFKVSFSLITYVINPDEFSDKSKGFASLWKNAIISLIMLILVPYAFSLAYNFQVMILEDNTLANLIFGQEETETNNYIGTAGSKMAFTVMLPFFSPNYSHQDLIDCTNMYDSDGKFNGSCREGLYSAIGKNSNVSNSMLENYILGVENKSIGMTFRVGIAKQTVKNSSSPNVKDDESFLIDYKLPISTVVATVTLLLLITFCMDVALRSVKLSFLQLIAPIPIISYIDPKNGKDGLFKKWYKMCFATYLSLFIRLAALYFGVYIISLVDSMQDVVNGSLITNGWVKIFIVIGVLMFAKQLPKILEGLGFKLDGDGKFSLNPFKKFGNEALGGKKILGAGAALGAAGLAGAVNMGARFGQSLNPNNWSRINPKTGKKEWSAGKILGNVAKIPLSGVAGASSALYRGIRKDAKGESVGKIFADSYGEAMYSKIKREDQARKAGAETFGEKVNLGFKSLVSDAARNVGILTPGQREQLKASEQDNEIKSYESRITRAKYAQADLKKKRFSKLEQLQNIGKDIDSFLESNKDVKAAKTAWENAPSQGKSNEEVEQLRQNYKRVKADALNTMNVPGSEVSHHLARYNQLCSEILNPNDSSYKEIDGSKISTIGKYENDANGSFVNVQGQHYAIEKDKDGNMFYTDNSGTINYANTWSSQGVVRQRLDTSSTTTYVNDVNGDSVVVGNDHFDVVRDSFGTYYTDNSGAVHFQNEWAKIGAVCQRKEISKNGVDIIGDNSEITDKAKRKIESDQQYVMYERDIKSFEDSIENLKNSKDYIEAHDELSTAKVADSSRFNKEKQGPGVKISGNRPLSSKLTDSAYYSNLSNYSNYNGGSTPPNNVPHGPVGPFPPNGGNPPGGPGPNNP